MTHRSFSYQHILIGLLLLATPFLLFPTGSKVLALSILPAILLIRWVISGHPIQRTPLDWPILLMLVMVLLSMWATFSLSFSIGKIAGVLFGIVIYYTVVDLIDKNAALRSVIYVFFLGGVSLAIVSSLGTNWLNKFPLIIPLLEKIPLLVRGVPGAEDGFHPNQVGGVLILFIPLQVALWVHTLKRSYPSASCSINSFFDFSRIKSGSKKGVFTPVLIGFSLLVTGGVLLLSQSRGAIGGLVVGLVTILAIRTRWGKVLAVALVVAVIGIISAGFADSLLTSGTLETEAIGTIKLTSRFELWSRAIEGISDFPFTGMGMNAFRQVMPVLYPAFSISPTWDFAHAHNHWLQVGLDLGLPGLIAYLALWLGAGFMLFQMVLKAKEQFYRVVALGLIGSFAAFFVFGITDTVALGAKPGFVFWWALGLVVATFRLFYQDQAAS